MKNVIRDVDDFTLSTIAGFSMEDHIYEQIIRGEAADYLNLKTMYEEHQAPCRKCASARVLWNQKPVMGQIASQITDNIIAEHIGCGYMKLLTMCL